jgi:nucleotide-binding universal stress UspA family protein
MYQKILVAYNGTPESRSALQECIRLAPGPGAEIHLLAVIQISAFLLVGEFVAEAALADEKVRMEQELNSGHAMMTSAGLSVSKHLEIGEPVAVIAEMVDKLGIELVIVGHSRQKPLAMRWWRGSMDALLVEKVRCSLLVAADSQ